MGKKSNHYLRDGTLYKGAYHKMPDGTLDTGKTHTSKSVRIFHFNELPTKAAKAKARKVEFKLK